MCSYQGFEFGAGSYPDSVCIDGRLFDADDCDGDGNLYEPMEEIPCPICNRQGAVEYWRGRNKCSGATWKEADKSARLLVNDIRANRGIEKRRTETV